MPAADLAFTGVELNDWDMPDWTAVVALLEASLAKS